MHDSVMEQQRRESHFSGGNFAYIEEMYEIYLRDPNAVPEQWRQEFDQLPRVPGSISGDLPHSIVKQHFALLGKNQSKSHPVNTASLSSDHERKQVSVVRLINAYRVHGHQVASLDPLNLRPKEVVQTLDLHFHELSAADLGRTSALVPANYS